MGLLQESPNIGQHRYYLTNDNALAAYVATQVGDADFAQTLRRSLDRYGYHDNDFVEVAWGEVIPWPPLHHKDLVVQKLSDRACDFLNVDETGAGGGLHFTGDPHAGPGRLLRLVIICQSCLHGVRQRIQQRQS